MFTRKKQGQRSDSPEIELFREKPPIGRSCALTSLCEKGEDLGADNEVIFGLSYNEKRKYHKKYYTPRNVKGGFPKTIRSVQGGPLVRLINVSLVGLGHPKDQLLIKRPACDLDADGKACLGQSHGDGNGGQPDEIIDTSATG